MLVGRWTGSINRQTIKHCSITGHLPVLIDQIKANKNIADWNQPALRIKYSSSVRFSFWKMVRINLTVIKWRSDTKQSVLKFLISFCAKKWWELMTTQYCGFINIHCQSTNFCGFHCWIDPWNQVFIDVCCFPIHFDFLWRNLFWYKCFGNNSLQT